MSCTNDEATWSKVWASRSHLYGDPYVPQFVRPPEENTHLRPATEILRGTYLREIAVRAALYKFLKVTPLFLTFAYSLPLLPSLLPSLLHLHRLV